MKINIEWDKPLTEYIEEFFAELFIKKVSFVHKSRSTYISI